MTDLNLLRLEAWEDPLPGATVPIELNRHGVSPCAIAWRATTAAGVVSIASSRMPFADGSFEAVVLSDLLEYVRDEKATLAEARRVLAPGGTLTMVVPALGPMMWLDAANWHRYLHDLTHSDRLIPELSESGWRRHYRDSDLVRLISEGGFALSAMQRSGTGFSEIGWFVGRLMEERVRRTVEPVPPSLAKTRRAVRSLDRRLPLGRFGSWLSVSAIRL